MKIRLDSAAKQELLDATAYLADKSSVAADQFLDDVEEAKARLLQFPRSGAPVGKSLRRLMLRRFAYQLVYDATETEIVIYAIAHHKRRPNYWRSRVSSSRSKTPK